MSITKEQIVQVKGRGFLRNRGTDLFSGRIVPAGTVFNAQNFCDMATLATQRNIIIFTGIANPTPMIEYVSKYTSHITVQSYPDHHNFTTQEIEKLALMVAQKEAIVITTEKDAARLRHLELPRQVVENSYILPLKTVVQPTKGRSEFDRLILQTVGIQA